MMTGAAGGDEADLRARARRAPREGGSEREARAAFEADENMLNIIHV